MANLQGQLLIAAPALVDPNFYRTVLLMLEHDEQGAMGLILNRRSDREFSELWEQVSSVACRREGPILCGGPCEGPLMMLHGCEAAAQMRLADDLYFSADPEKLAILADEAADEPAMAFVGYAGWSPGQLEYELDEGSWLPADLPADLLETEIDWNRLIRLLSPGAIEVRVTPDDPTMN